MSILEISHQMCEWLYGWLNCFVLNWITSFTLCKEFRPWAICDEESPQSSLQGDKTKNSTCFFDCVFFYPVVQKLMWYWNTIKFLIFGVLMFHPVQSSSFKGDMIGSLSVKWTTARLFHNLHFINCVHTTVIALLYFHKTFSVEKRTNPLYVWWNGSKRKVTFFKLEWIFHAPFHHTFYITHTKDMSSFLQRLCVTHPFADKKEELWHLRKFPLWAAPRRWAMKKPLFLGLFLGRKGGNGFLMIYYKGS